MENFIFQNPTKLIFGKGSIAKLNAEIPENAVIMMTYGGGSIKKNGVYQQVKEALKNRSLIEFGGIEANPHYETLMQAVTTAQKAGVTYLLAVGGGSVIDGTKFISCAVHYNGKNAWEILTDPAVSKKITPVKLATVLTLPATGSEMNNGAVITRAATNEKLAFHHPLIFPQFSILDPEVCYSLPQRQIANGIADTFAHVLEQYLTYPVNALVQDRFSEGILLTLTEIGVPLLNHHENYDLMSNFMFAATMGLNGIIAMGVPQDWATHMIGHELTAMHGLDHGVTLAIVFPALMEVMRDEKHEKLLQYGERVWGINSGNPELRIDKAIEHTRSFFESLGIKTHLRDYNIGQETINVIVERFTKRCWRLGERQSVSPEKVRDILNKAL